MRQTCVCYLAVSSGENPVYRNWICSLLLAVSPFAIAQQSMKMPMNMSGKATTFLGEVELHDTSGTSAEPNSTPIPMLMTMRGDWMLMFHANAFVANTQQTSPRGGDKFFSTNWFMPMAQHAWGPGQVTLRAMFSLEPWTVSGRQYPLLFQEGETAYGKPIVDGQHPHDFVMELAALYDLRLGEKTLLTFYAAPVGDPAIGPTAYPHRASAMENPVAPLGHHQEDSTHIADDVVTVGFTRGMVRLEGSGFHGREPNEHRWQVQQGAIDSWSTRLTVQPRQNWSGQYSYGRIHSPEQLFPTENQERMTASVMYNRPLGDGAKGNWASTAAICSSHCCVLRHGIMFGHAWKMWTGLRSCCWGRILYRRDLKRSQQDACRRIPSATVGTLTCCRILEPRLEDRSRPIRWDRGSGRFTAQTRWAWWCFCACVWLEQDSDKEGIAAILTASK
jgi:hypothetical protein